MPDVFSNAPEDDEDGQTPGVRVAGALTGDGEDAPEVEEAPQAQQPQGTVDSPGQSYLTPAGADDDEGQPSPAENDEPVSADTKAYMTPITPPTLAKPAAFADHSADTAAMTAQKQAEAAENVKPSIGRKILAALSAGAAGFGSRNPEVGAKIGQEILAGPRTNAEARWATQEAPIQARLNADQAADAATTRANVNTEQGNKLAETNYSNQIRGQQDAARADNYNAQAQTRRDAITAFTPDDPKNPYAGGTGTTADGRTIKGVPPPDKWLATWEKNPTNVANAQAQRGVATLKALEDSGVKLTPEQRAIVASGGKVTPAVRTNINIRENPDGSAVTPVGAAGQAGPGEVIAKNMQDKQSYIDSLTKLPDGTFTNGAGDTITQKQFNDRLEKFRTDLNANPVMRKSGTMVDPQGNTVSNRFSRNPQTSSPQAQPQSPAASQQPAYKAKSGATVTVGTYVVVAGKPGIVTGFDAKGKPIVK